MNKAEFIQTLSGYVPEKLIDTLAENAAWDGLFYEESESDKEAPDYFSIPFPTDLADKEEKIILNRIFKDHRNKIKDMLKKYSADSQNANRPPKIIESKELTAALESIDDMVDIIGRLIINIAHNNDDFVCTECLYTAGKLYQIMRKYAREDDAARIYDEFKEITGRCIDD